LLLTQQFLGFVFLLGWLKADRHIRNSQNTFFLAYQKLHVGCHTGLEQQLFVVDSHNSIIGHYILHDRCGVAHLVNLTRKTARRIGVHRKRNLLPLPDIADVRLVNAGMHFHL